MSLLYLFFPESDYIYTSAGLYTHDFFFENICSYADYSKEYWNAISGDNLRIMVFPSTKVKVRYHESIEVIPIVTLNKIEGHIALSVTNQPTNKLIEMMTGDSLTEDTEFIILDSAGRILMYTGEDDLQDEEITAMSIVESGRCYGKKRIFQYYSETSGRTYISIVSEHELNKITNTYIIYLILLVVAIIALGILVAYLFAIKIYRPINIMATTIKSADSNKSNSSLIAKRDADEKKINNDILATIQHGINSLINEEKSYKESCSEYAEYYIEKSIHLIINDIPEIDFSQLKEDLNKFYNFKSESYLFACIQFDFTRVFFEQNKNLNEMYNNIGYIIQTLIDTQLPCYTMELQGGMYLCLINCDMEDSIDEVTSLFNSIKVIFKEDIQYYSISVGIGGHFTNLSSMKESYNQSIQAIRYCTSGESFQMYDYSSVPIKSKVTFSFYDQRKIVNSIMNGNNEMLNQVLNQIMDINNRKDISSRNMKELYRQLFSVGQRCLDDYGIAKDELKSESKIRLALQYDYKHQEISQIRNTFIEYFNEIFELANVNDMKKSARQIDVIKEYVLNNYKENLYLDSIADVMGITPKYLSRFFKLQTDMNLTDYINEIRMEKAKELLSSTNVQIGKISTMVGIYSRATFIRNFKKIEGCSPSEYRINTHKAT